MNSQLDRQIYKMMRRVVDESPLPPELSEPSTTPAQSRPRVPGWAAAFAAAAVLFMVVGGTAVLFRGGTSDVGQDAIPTTTGIADETATGLPVADGRTVEVVVSGVSGHDGGELAGVVYAGDALPDLDRDALGGFWAVVDGDPFAVTEVVRSPGDDADLVGRFPYVSDEAMVVEPGIYTLVLWTDLGLSPVSRWVPVNSDGQGLFGCHVTFEVGDETQTAVAVSATLHPDGWNVDCETGQVIPGTDASAAVAPPDW